MRHRNQPSLNKIVPGGIMDRRRGWYVFRIFNLYRLVLAAIVTGIFFLDDESRFFGGAHPELFLATAAGYMAVVVVSIALSYRRRPALTIQSHAQAAVDLVALSLMIQASGGFASNLTVLLVIAVAASGILLPLGSALAVALVAFAGMVSEWLIHGWLGFAAADAPGRITIAKIARFLEQAELSGDELVRTGLFGASFCIAAVITHTLAERARHSEELVRQRTQSLMELAELNEIIVRQLQSGIIVVDRLGRIRLMNNTACDLLNHHRPVEGTALSDVSSVLSQRLAAWLSSGLNNPKPFRQDEHLPDVTPIFAHLRGHQAYDTLVFLEDSTQAAQRLQQIKLAALGRLTAGIAHEIRNPLASISHAAQLLEESTSASAGDRRLGRIVHENAQRANKIISNVMDMSRRDKAKPEDFAIHGWLERFGREFLRSRSERTPKIEIRVDPPDQVVRFDPSQLHQVLWNLCSNACQHGVKPDVQPRIRLAAGFDPVRGRPYLDVIDSGSGIPEAEARKIFEPFFTTQSRGTGLGLYIAREMCEANRAQLQYIRPNGGGSCFRITFANPVKQEQQWTLGMH